MIHTGDLVRVRYTTRSLEGGVIETSDNREPLQFTAGGPEVISGLSRGVIGLSEGETRTLNIPPEQAFGRHNPDLVQSSPRWQLPPGISTGDQLATTVAGVDLDVWVQKLTASEAVLDSNHPLAGETLVVDVKVISVLAK